MTSRPLGRRLAHLVMTFFAFLLVSPDLTPAWAQVLPDGAGNVPWQCPPPDDGDEPPSEPSSEAERLELERRARYREVLPAYIAAVPPEVDSALAIPVAGVRVREVADTFGAPRSGSRTHEGQDIFAPAGTPVLSATAGFVFRVGESPLGGKVVIVVGAGGRRYYYAHLSAFGEIREGQAVTTQTVLGFVGNSGNAAGTPPHLHFGVYQGPAGSCDWDAIDPLPLLVDRTP